MKNKTLSFIVFAFISLLIKAQNSNDILNLLIENKTITQIQADSVRAEAAIKQQEADAKKKWFPITAGKAFQLSGYTQARYQNFEEKGKVSGFDIRRARLDAKGDITPYFGYRLQYELAVSPKLLDAYVDYKLFDYLNFRLGQFTVPFSLENTTSDTKLFSIDRSLVVENLSSRKGDVIGDNNGRDIGLQVGGSFLKLNDIPLIEYNVGIFNGVGINKSDNYKYKDLSGRLIFHIIKGVDLGVSAYNGKYIHDPSTKITPDTTQKITIQDGVKTITIKQDSTTTKTTEYSAQDRIRYGADINVELFGASFKAEYLDGTNGISNKTNAKIKGYYVQLGYFVIPGKFQGIAKYEDFENDSPIAKEISDISKIIIGLNYNISNNSRLQIAYNIVDDKNNSGKFNQAVAQFQIGF
jgi:phosphate-selective porin OprO and OprP